MTLDEAALQTLLDKDAIRELAMLYSRAIDRKDSALLRDLYTEDATDTHGTDFDGTVSDFVAFIESTAPYMTYSGHHVCNHLIEVSGDTATGEVYVLAVHCLEAGEGKQVEDWHVVRYMDNYSRCADGKWRFAKRFVTYDMVIARPFEGEGLLGAAPDPSYRELASRLFAQGARG
ncbi:MAG: nuclear transport factor 2 family protein [Novosphingobium sp.]|nr:nuclear transport factor 2 family protein [Novosphingobium sp.]